MSVRLDRPPIALSNRFACLEEEERYVYSFDELTEIRKTVPKEDLKLKQAIQAIMGEPNPAEPQRADRKARNERQAVRSSNQNGAVHRIARQRFHSQPKDPVFRHFHTKKVWVAKGFSKK